MQLMQLFLPPCTERLVTAKSRATIDRAIELGRLAITDDLSCWLRQGALSGDRCHGQSNVGTSFALDAIHNGKHVVMLNVEATSPSAAISRRKPERGCCPIQEPWVMNRPAP